MAEEAEGAVRAGAGEEGEEEALAAEEEAAVAAADRAAGAAATGPTPEVERHIWIPANLSTKKKLAMFCFGGAI